MDRIERRERPAPLNAGPERAQLESWLEFHRATLLVKCADLTLEQLCQRPVASSALSLLGLVRHMTFVEQVWFQTIFAGREVADYYKTPDDRDADFHDLDSATLHEVVALYDATCATSRELAAGHDLDEMAAVARRHRHVDLRWIYVHMIEEYARHNGHADLLRELIDGETGY
ncbi:MAG: DinB family protein [Acidimicrobiales bacterium]